MNPVVTLEALEIRLDGEIDTKAARVNYDGSGWPRQKNHFNLADVKVAYDRYILQRTNFKPKPLAVVLSI